MASDGFHSKAPTSLSLAGSPSKVRRSRHQALICIKASSALMNRAILCCSPVRAGTSLNGLKDLAGDIIVPFTERMAVVVLWGEWDGWIPPADLRTMAAAMPDCRLITVPGIGHSINPEVPALYADYLGAWFGGLPGSEVAI
jgi:pimeloyl-ACP methyl ester carboxylesterase